MRIAVKTNYGTSLIIVLIVVLFLIHYGWEISEINIGDTIKMTPPEKSNLHLEEI